MQMFMKKAPLKLLLYRNTGATIASSLIHMTGENLNMQIFIPFILSTFLDFYSIHITSI